MTRVRVFIGILAGIAFAALVINFIINGVDAPQGILWLLGSIIGFVFSPELAAKIKGSKDGND